MHDAVREVFVCTQNSARPQLAAAWWNDTSTVPATSAGTHPAAAVHPDAVAAAQRTESRWTRFPRDTQRRPKRRRHADSLVITVCDAAHEEPAAHGAVHDAGRSRLHWSIPDRPRPAGTRPSTGSLTTSPTSPTLAGDPDNPVGGHPTLHGDRLDPRAGWRPGGAGPAQVSGLLVGQRVGGWGMRGAECPTPGLFPHRCPYRA